MKCTHGRMLIVVLFFRHNEVYTWQNVNCCVHNIIVGKIWVEHVSEVSHCCRYKGAVGALIFSIMYG